MSEEMMVNPNEFADVEGLFDDKQGRGGIYLSIFDFSICQRSKTLPANPEGWEGPFDRTNPNTKEVVTSFAKRHDRLIARIADAHKETKEFAPEKGGGKVTNYNITFLSGGERMTLQLVYCDQALKRFLKVAPNINLRMPVLISAFQGRDQKTGKAKQAISFKQFKGDPTDRERFRDVNNWEKVEEYWKPALGPNGERIEGADYVGADGSILPKPIHDEEDGTWDYKPQNKFLANYFRVNVLPKVKELAAHYGLNNEDVDSTVPGQDITHSGPPVDDTPVTTKPFNTVAQSIGDMITGAHTARIKQLSTAQGIDPEMAAKKLCETDLGSLTDEAGRYIIYKLEERLQKTGGVAPAAPAPVAPPPPPPPPPPATPAPDGDLWDIDDDDLAQAKPVTAPYDPNSNDDVPW